ncbi:MAG TPA: P1 family peptidase [Streptosporangiaceae bacterium]|nr:P1 family peptidase [Streptosporangiaceae bacterium]
MTRTADLGIRIGILPSGPTASIADVPGVGVGHATVWRDEPPPPAGRGVARTGVTVLDLGGNMFRSPVPAGGAVLNGAGECTGFLAAAEWGLAETPVFLTSTMQLGRVYDAACELLMAEDTAIGTDDVIIPIVAECDDSFLNDARRMQVTAADVSAALEAARAAARGRERTAPAEGAVGAGTGMSCLGFKGGIGTASRLTPSGHTVGVLVLSNFGEQDRLTIDGMPVGRRLPPAVEAPAPPPAGSCITVVVTDAPLDSAACVRLARRAGLGLARTGSTGHHGSGEIFLALATGLRAPRIPRPDSSAGGAPGAGVGPITGRGLDPFFAAVVEATEEAVLNSMLAAPSVNGRDGNVVRGLPVDQVKALLHSRA